MRWKWIAEPESVDHPHTLANREQLAHQHAANIARPAGNQNHPVSPSSLTATWGHPRSPQALVPQYRSGGNSTLDWGQGVDRADSSLVGDDVVSLFQVALELGMCGQPW